MPLCRRRCRVVASDRRSPQLEQSFRAVGSTPQSRDRIRRPEINPSGPPVAGRGRLAPYAGMLFRCYSSGRWLDSGCASLRFVGRGRTVLSFVEEIVLLQLDESGRPVKFPLEAADVVLAGAVIMELALQERIDTDLNRLFVDDPRPSGDEILDHALAVLVEAGQNFRISPAIERLNLKTSDAIQGITLHASRYRDEALQRLIEKVIVREETSPSFRRYQIVDNSGQREVGARLRQLILTDDIPNSRDVVLVSLIPRLARRRPGFLDRCLRASRSRADDGRNCQPAAADRAADPPRSHRASGDKGCRRNPVYPSVHHRSDQPAMT